MADIPFFWPVDLELSRIRTLYGNGENPVLPYEPPSTVIKVSKFSLGTVAGMQWFLQFEHTKIYDSSFYGQQEKAALLLERNRCDGNVEIEGSVSLYDTTAHKMLSKNDFNENLTEGTSVLPISLNLYMSDFSEVVFENSKLCVQGYVSIYQFETSPNDGEVQSESITNSEIHMIKNNPLVQLSYDLVSLLEEEAFSDVTIKCDSAEILAHKNILSVRSPIFAAMFKSNMVEGEGNELIITDVKLPVFRKFLIFLYSSQVKDLDVKMACDLLYVSDKYQISGLKEICGEYLKCSLTADNALEILSIADLYHSDLKNFVIDYISSYFSHFENLNEWKDLKQENQSLFIDVLEHTLKFRLKKNIICNAHQKLV